MRTRIKTLVTKTAMFALAVAASTALCSGQETSARPALMIVGGQGAYVSIPDMRPAPLRYALTGEQSPFRQTLQAWQAQAGPVFRVGNASIIIAPTR